MNFCPKNSGEFGHHPGPEHARDWCGRSPVRVECSTCEYTHKHENKGRNVDVVKDVFKPTQARLF